MGNTILTPTMILREALRILTNELAFTRNVNREYDSNFAKKGAKIGNTANVRKPNRYVTSKGATLVTQDTTEESVSIVMDQQAHVGVNFSSVDLTLSLDDFSKRILKPAIATIANTVDFEGLSLYKDIYNLVGTPGTTPATAAALLGVGQRMDEEAVPRDGDRFAIVNPAANAALIDGLKTLFNPSGNLSTQFQKGMMGNNVLGFGTIGMDQNVNVHTVGPLGGTPLVNGANQTGSSLTTKGWTAAAAARLKKGDVFTIAGVYAVNPQNRQSTGILRQFVVTADFSSAVDGTGAVSIYPAIVTSGAKQTVTGSPADNAAITVVGTANTNYPMNLGYHKDAFTLVTADLEMPSGVDFAARESYEGISMRIVRQYDLNNDKFPCRIDVLYGWKTIYPELACRLIG